MQIVAWDQSLQFGIASIDAQHRRLVDLTNSMHAAVIAGTAQQLLGEALNELIAYTQEHFAYEETLFACHGFDGAAHVKQHQELTTQVLDLKRRFDTGEQALSVHLVYFLRDWLVTHIRGSDALYVPFLKSKGVG